MNLFAITLDRKFDVIHDRGVNKSSRRIRLGSLFVEERTPVISVRYSTAI